MCIWLVTKWSPSGNSAAQGTKNIKQPLGKAWPKSSSPRAPSCLFLGQSVILLQNRPMHERARVQCTTCLTMFGFLEGSSWWHSFRQPLCFWSQLQPVAPWWWLHCGHHAPPSFLLWFPGWLGMTRTQGCSQWCHRWGSCQSSTLWLKDSSGCVGKSDYLFFCSPVIGHSSMHGVW